MTLGYIEPNNTTLKEINGRQVWVNPDISIGIDKFTGEVINTSHKSQSEYGNSISPQHKTERFSIYLYKRSNKYSYPTPYRNILSMMFFGKLCGRYSDIFYKDKNNEVISKETLEIIHKSEKRKSLVTIKLDRPQLSLSVNSKEEKSIPFTQERMENLVDPNVPYITNKSPLYIVTSDGKKFEPTEMELAKEHQDAVNVGINIANTILESKAGYVLAEKVFLQSIGDKKFYKDFSEMLNLSKTQTLPKEVFSVSIKLDMDSYNFSGLHEVCNALKSHSFNSTEQSDEATKELKKINASIDTLFEILTR